MVQEAPDRDGFVTYEEAKDILGVSLKAVTQAVTRGTLHPKKFSHDRRKYLYRSEVEWYRRRQQGERYEPNPYEVVTRPSYFLSEVAGLEDETLTCQEEIEKLGLPQRFGVNAHDLAWAIVQLQFKEFLRAQREKQKREADEALMRLQAYAMDTEEWRAKADQRTEPDRTL